MATVKIREFAALRKTNAPADWYGILCSLLCLLHCSLIPLLLWVLPVLAETHWLGQPIFHQCAALICAGIAIQSIVPGYRVNKSRSIALLAGTGLAILLATAFILPDACCQSAELQLIPHAINTSSFLTGDFVSNLEYCSYFGDVSHEPHGEPDQIHLISPMITVDQLQFSLGVANMRPWQMIQPWLSRSGGLLLLLAHGLNLRGRQRSHRNCCRNQPETDGTVFGDNGIDLCA